MLPTRAKEKLYITGTIAKLEETLARISMEEMKGAIAARRSVRSKRFLGCDTSTALAGHSAMRNLYLDYGIPAGSTGVQR